MQSPPLRAPDLPSPGTQSFQEAFSDHPSRGFSKIHAHLRTKGFKAERYLDVADVAQH